MEMPTLLSGEDFDAYAQRIRHDPVLVAAKERTTMLATDVARAAGIDLDDFGARLMSGLFAIHVVVSDLPPGQPRLKMMAAMLEVLRHMVHENRD